MLALLRLAGHAQKHGEGTPDSESDIRYIHLEGRRILEGANPYSRIASSDMEDNNKYATYLPGIYLAAASMQAAGLREFPEWLGAWRAGCAFFWAATGALLFVFVYGAERRLVAAVAASAMWLFNRWSLHVLLIAHTDFLAVFFFALCVMLLGRWPRWAWLAFGVSLSVKHIAVLAMPLLLVAQWQALPAGARRWRAMLWALAAAAAVPAVLSAPFVAADPAAFVKSMLFSVTREARTHLGLWSLDMGLDFEGAKGRIPMLLLLGGATWLFARRQLTLHAALFLVMAAFVWFNSVFFRQYAVWPIPFALMAVFRGGADDSRPGIQPSLFALGRKAPDKPTA
jgi:hypothetical protein